MTEIKQTELEEKYKEQARKIWGEGYSLTDLMVVIEECIEESKGLEKTKVELAAPELLEALKTAISWLPVLTGYMYQRDDLKRDQLIKDMEKMRAVILKATE